MLHGALAELHAAEGEDRLRLGDTVARLFLRPTGRAQAEMPAPGRSQTAAGDTARPDQPDQPDQH
jgi:hypothetical protein